MPVAYIDLPTRTERKRQLVTEGADALREAYLIIRTRALDDLMAFEHPMLGRIAAAMQAGGPR